MNRFTLRQIPFANVNGVESSTVNSADAPTDKAEHSADIAARDWDCLFAAVIDRIRRVAAEPLTEDSDTQLVDKLSSVQVGLTECVQSLVQLRDSMNQEIKHRDHLVAEVERVRVALAQLHAQAEVNAADARELRERRLALHDYACGAPNCSGLSGD